MGACLYAHNCNKLEPLTQFLVIYLILATCLNFLYCRERSDFILMQKVKTLIKRPFSWFKRASKKKKIITIIAGVIILLVVIQQVGSSNTPPPYTLAKAEVTDVSEVVSETGNIVTNNSTEVYSPTNGIVDNLYVTNGDKVTEGQELFTVKSTATDQETQAAYSNYLTALSALNAAKSNANLYRADMYAKWKEYTDLATNSTYETDDGHAKESERLAAEFQISQDSWKAAEAKYNDQQTAIAQAQAAVSSTSLLYQATQNATVKAQVAGTVANLSLSQGGTVKAVTPTVVVTPALTLANFSTTEVLITLTETDAIKVKPGQDVTLDISAVDDKTYKGTVVRVDDIGTSNKGVIQYSAYIEINNPDKQLKSGMTVDVDITTKKVSDVLAVPNSAVKPYKGGRAVRIVDPKTKELVFVPVQIGIKGEQKTQIIKGLKDGQEIVTALSNDQIKRSSLF